MWEPNVWSVHDGSPARLINTMYFIQEGVYENEAGERWIDKLANWSDDPATQWKASK